MYLFFYYLIGYIPFECIEKTKNLFYKNFKIRKLKEQELETECNQCINRSNFSSLLITALNLGICGLFFTKKFE